MFIVLNKRRVKWMISKLVVINKPQAQSRTAEDLRKFENLNLLNLKELAGRGSHDRDRHSRNRDSHR